MHESTGMPATASPYIFNSSLCAFTSGKGATNSWDNPERNACAPTRCCKGPGAARQSDPAQVEASEKKTQRQEPG